MGNSALAFRQAQIGACIEQVILYVIQHLENRGVVHMQACDPDHRIGFVNAPGSGHAGVKFWKARAVAQGRFPVIPRTRINFIEFHREFRRSMESYP